MFNVNEQAVKAEPKYRRELLRDQNQTSGHPRKRAQTVLIAAALAVVVAACGVPTDEIGAIEAPIQIDKGNLTDPGPSWQPNTGAVNKGPVVIVPEFGGMSAPSWQPRFGLLHHYLPDYGVFAGPTWQPDRGELEKVLGIDTSVFAGPSHLPDYEKLDQILNPEYSTPASGPR